LEMRRKYMKRGDTLVVAIQLDLDMIRFTCRKWGGEQTCKPGDWLVNNGGDVYTVDRDSFARTYRAESLGCYRKIAPVWAERADHSGAIKTKEGMTQYEAGDYLVFNDEEGQDGYAVTVSSFEAMYEPAE
jgi:hypothetical protein